MRCVGQLAFRNGGCVGQFGPGSDDCGQFRLKFGPPNSAPNVPTSGGPSKVVRISAKSWPPNQPGFGPNQPGFDRNGPGMDRNGPPK